MLCDNASLLRITNAILERGLFWRIQNESDGRGSPLAGSGSLGEPSKLRVVEPFGPMIDGKLK
ncbi:MAG: hypothetical protein VX034_11790, partial [Planctomycetota bacterium]|nr:hypothetical protein [Planctomycetota bacterium]